MNPEYKDIALIDDYLSGRLSTEETLALEKRIGEDPEFANEVRIQKISRELIEDHELLKVKRQMKKDLSAPSSFIKFWLLGLLAAVSALVLFLVLTKHEHVRPNRQTVQPGNRSGADKNFSNGVEQSKDMKQGERISFGTYGNNYKSNVDTLRNSTGKDLNSALSSIPSETVQSDDNEKNKEKEKVLQEENPCANLKIEYAVSKENTCDNQQTGSLSIVAVKGGKLPYSYRLEPEEKFTSAGYFNNLPAGEYTISIKEGSNCIYKIADPVIISSKRCSQTFNQTFTPSQDDVWKLPVISGQSGHIHMIDKTGVTVYETDFSGGYANEWNGINNKGQETPAGYYIVIIELTDGTIINGYLTVNR